MTILDVREVLSTREPRAPGHWRPLLNRGGGPLYQGIASAIAAGITDGTLRPGARLPTQRELADTLQVTVATVTRGYAEAERRGLISGEVGRGTFVRELPAGVFLNADARGVDLSVNSLFPFQHAGELLARLSSPHAGAARPDVLGYQAHAGAAHHRTAGAQWVARRQIDTAPDRVLVTAGAQHAMAVTFATITRPGDVVLTEALTYPGIKSLANLLHFRLHGVAMDAHGLQPDALRAACRATGARVLYCMPTLQNPTSAVMPAARRSELAQVAETCDLTLVEDDTYGFLVPEPAPVSCLVPDRSIYITSVSKSLAPGLRIGYVVAPSALVERLAASIFATMVMAPPPAGEAVSAWIADGTADRIVDWKRKEVVARQQIASGILRYEAHPSSPHLWLRLPDPWRAQDFVLQAQMREIRVAGEDGFIVGRDARPHAVRISLGPPQNHEVLEQALRTLADILRHPPEQFRSVV